MMHLTFQIPIADARSFVDPPEVRIERPLWPTPDANSEFVRAFGRIRRQPGRRLNEWVSEPAVCDAKRAIRFSDLDRLRSTFPWGEVTFQGAYRSLVSDGQAFCKFEIGCNVIAHYTRQNRSGQSQNHAKAEILTRFLNAKVRVPVPESLQEPISLFSATSAIARLYRASTSAENLSFIGSNNKWIVRSCAPVFILIMNKKDSCQSPIQIPAESKQYIVPGADRISLYHFFHAHGGPILVRGASMCRKITRDVTGISFVH